MFGKRPIFFIALSFFAGILSFYFAFFFILLFIPFLFVSSGKISRKESVLLAMFFLLGTGYIYAYNFFSDNGRTETVKRLTGKKVTVQGKVIRKVSRKSYFMDADTLILAGKKFPTDLRMYVKAEKELKRGEYIKISGKMKSVSDLQGSFAYYLFSRDVQGVLFNGKKTKVLKFQGNLADKLRAGLENRILHFPTEAFSRGLLLALLTGNKSELSREDKELFTRSGTAHLLAVSGLHVGILLSFVMLLSLPGYYFDLKKKYIYGLAVVSIWAFAVFTGGSASVLRASLMTSIFLLAKIFAKKVDIFNVIGISMYILLWINPVLALDIGFQMSFAAVLGIVILFPLLRDCFSPNSKYLLIKYLYDSTLVSLSAQLGVMPLTLYWFGTFPMYFLPANLFVVPLIFLIFYTGLFYAIVDVPVTREIYVFLVKILRKYLSFITELPASVLEVPSHNIWVFVFSAGGVILLSWGIYILNKNRRGRTLPRELAWS